MSTVLYLTIKILEYDRRISSSLNMSATPLNMRATPLNMSATPLNMIATPLEPSQILQILDFIIIKDRAGRK